MNSSIHLSIFVMLVFSTISVSAANVISWVAPYKIDESKAMLDSSFGTYSMKDGLSHLALQFYITNGAAIKHDGNIAEADFDDVVSWFVDWGKANDVKVMLCVDNYVDGWNWPEAVRSFRDNRSAFVQSLMNEVDRMGFDGVELDLEGNGDFDADRADFAAFVNELSVACRAKGKEVTVAAFSDIWNAPSSAWWPDLFPLVEGITSMGYQEIGRNAADWAGYAVQKEKASDAPEKLMLGMPGSEASWQNNTVEEQLDWVVEDGVVGVGIWDAALDNEAWQTDAVWEKLNAIRARSETGVLSQNGSSANKYLMSVDVIAGRGLNISVPLASASDVTVQILDLRGRVISTLFSGVHAAGEMRCVWGGVDKKGVGGAVGAYVVRVGVNGVGESRMVVVR